MRAVTCLTNQCHYPTHSTSTRTANRLTDQRYYPARSMSTRAVTRLTDQSYYQTHSTSTRAVTRLTDQCHYPTQSTSTRAATRLTDQCHYPTHSMLTRTVNRLTDQRYYPAHSMSMKVAAIFSAEIKSFFPNVFSPLLYFLLQANCFHNSDGNLLACAIFSFKINRFVPGHVRLCCCFFFMQANCFHSSDARFFLVYGKSYLPKSFAPLLFLLGATELFHNSNGRRWRARFFFV